ncbi:MAG: DUF72 domain-containing protein [Wenzhouxiangella sp.]|jgi:uncharacterized protein YecE (DUF72 family)|nr:DUF72 domain-containing protein [Wenzhouxiangella sp.]
MTENGAAVPYRLGLPAWGFAGWKGRYFHVQGSLLPDYARVFNAVEGNTSFYRIPEAATVSRWVKAVAGCDFEFCWKLPREVTHETRPDLDLLDTFLARIAPLGRHNGPLLVQFSDRTGPNELDTMRRILARLPADRRHVIEVRHPAFFDQPERLEAVLAEFGLGRVCMDTRSLYQGDPNHPDIQRARHEKPDVPVLPPLSNGLEFIRLVLHPDPKSNERWIDLSAQRAAQAIKRGEAVYVMIHCPNNQHCPELATAFHGQLGQALDRLDWPPLPPWPVAQQSLF